MSYQNFAGYAGDLLAIDAYTLLEGDSSQFLSTFGPRRSGRMWGRRIFKRLARRHCSWNGKAILQWRLTPILLRALRKCCSQGCGAGRLAGILVSFGRAVAPGRNRDDERGWGHVSMCRMGSKVRWTHRVEGAASAGGRRADCPGRKRKSVTRVPFLGIAARRQSTSRLRQTMDMYDEPDPDRFDQAVRPSSAWRSLAALLRSLAGGSRRRCFQQLVRQYHPGIGRIGAGSTFRPNPLSQELDRDPLFRACRFGAERRSRTGRANLDFRSLLGAARAASQMPAARVRLDREDDASKPLEPPGDRAPADRRAPNRTPAGLAAGDALTGSPLDRRLTFATFQVGRSNELAFNAVQRVANPNRNGTPAFCPLYVHSAVGLGKTHLLQAVAHTAAQQGRSVIYLTAEKFMYGFVAACSPRPRSPSRSG